MANREDRVEDMAGDADPTEEAGPEECEIKPNMAEFAPGELDASPDGSHPKFSEELMEAYDPQPEVSIFSPVDGLPIPVNEKDLDDAAYAPPFTLDTVVCVEDARSYVEVFDGRGRSRYDRTGAARKPRRFKPSLVKERFGELIVVVPRPWWRRDEQVRVQPIRPVCEYYTRQVFANDGEPDPDAPGHKIVFRNCSMRRSVGGAFLSLRDEAIFACSLRSPPHPASMKQHLDDPDAERLKSTEHLRRLAIYREKT